MTKEELKIWFCNKFNNCYYVKHKDYPQSYFMFYDEQWLRQKKLCRITGEEVEYPTEVKGVCLFEQDYKNKYLYMDYDKITSYFSKNYSGKWLEIKELIKGWLEEQSKMEVLTPRISNWGLLHRLEEQSKMEVLTPKLGLPAYAISLEEQSKMEVLTPSTFREIDALHLEEHSKMEVLTPSLCCTRKKNILEVEVLTPNRDDFKQIIL